MAVQAILFVSKRLQRMAFALLCLTVAQLMLASFEPNPAVSVYSGTIGE